MLHRALIGITCPLQTMQTCYKHESREGLAQRERVCVWVCVCVCVLARANLCRLFWKSVSVCRIHWSATCSAPQITPSIVSGLSACQNKTMMNDDSSELKPQNLLPVITLSKHKPSVTEYSHTRKRIQV